MVWEMYEFLFTLGFLRGGIVWFSWYGAYGMISMVGRNCVCGEIVWLLVLYENHGKLVDSGQVFGSVVF